MGSVTNLRYHLVLTTKYRRPVLQGIEQSVYDAFREVEKVSDFKIIEMNVEDGNHIRLALKMSPRYSVSSVVNRIKGLTTHLVWEREPQHLFRFYREGKRCSGPERTSAQLWATFLMILFFGTYRIRMV